MKKKIIVLMAAAGTILASGCSSEVSTGTETEKDVDIQAAAAEIEKEIDFEDSLSELEEDTALTYYGISGDAVKDSVVYVSTGATAEEIAIFEAADTDSKNTVEDACNQRKEKQTTSYGDYKPSEVSRLDDAIIETYGNYVVYIVTDDVTKADEILESYFQ
jgi:hypothetical protein